MQSPPALTIQLCLHGVPGHPGAERLRAGDYPSLQLQQPVAFDRKRASHELSVATPQPARYAQFNSVDTSTALWITSDKPSPASQSLSPARQPTAELTR